MPTVTQWFDPKVDGQPVRVGNFERKYYAGTQYDYWDGELFWPSKDADICCAFQELPWRCLTEHNEEKQ